MVSSVSSFFADFFQTRDSKEAQVREHLALLEGLRLRSAAELRDFGRELAAAGKELENSRDAARESEGRASKLEVCAPYHSCYGVNKYVKAGGVGDNFTPSSLRLLHSRLVDVGVFDFITIVA